MNAAVGRRLLAEFTGTGLLVAPAFIAAQIVGGALGTLLAITVYPVRRSRVRIEEPAQVAG